MDNSPVERAKQKAMDIWKLSNYDPRAQISFGDLITILDELGEYTNGK